MGVGQQGSVSASIPIPETKHACRGRLLVYLACFIDSILLHSRRIFASPLRCVAQRLGDARGVKSFEDLGLQSDAVLVTSC